MAWLAITLNVDALRAEALSDALLASGAIAVDIGDARAGARRESTRRDAPIDCSALPWGVSTVSALFDEHADIAASVAAALRASEVDPARGYGINRVDDQDWVRSTQSQFVPVRVSPRMWVVPSWHTPPDPHAINLAIDPGLAFGTGAHPTTQLCLEWLDAHLRGGEHVLDYGCGSGILAIAALKLGAARATGIDIDDSALLAARRNAMQNQVTVEFKSADPLPSASFDIVLANILANPLRMLAPVLAEAARGGGAIVLSGILDDQAHDVVLAYDEWFTMNTTRSNDGWVLLAGVRRETPRGRA